MRADGGAKMATIQQTFAFLQAEDASSVSPFAPQKSRQQTTFAEPKGTAPKPPREKDFEPFADSEPPFADSEPPFADSEPTAQSVCEDTPEDRQAVLRRLRAQVGCVSTAPTQQAENLSTACQAIDAMLPGGGLKPHAITEWVAESDSSGAAALSLIAAATHLRSLPAASPLLIADLDGTFYPPAAVALGIPMDQIILVRPRRHADLVWAIDQALRSEAVAAVWAHVGARLDDRDARRFQLAAETGNTPGFLIRPGAVRGRPSFADVRFHVAGEPMSPGVYHHQEPGVYHHQTSGVYHHQDFAQLKHRLLQVTLDRCRGGVVGQNVWVQIDDQAQVHHVSFSKSVHHETAAVHLASQLANPTTAQSTDRKRRA